ncbi:MAG: O-methyltransferase [Candidatus Bathyarchaeia archaeon]
MVLSKAEKVLRDIEGIARGKRFLPIVGPSKGQILNKVVREAKPKRILEVGALIGYSAILMGKALGKEAHLITIEIDADNAEIAKENIRKAEIPPTVEVLIGDAIEVIPELEGRFDLIFIDAEKAKYLDYLRLIEDKLHRGSIIVADNVARAPAYLDYIRSSGKYSSRFIRVGEVTIAQHSDHNRENGLEVSTKT